jgi:hypothetical protein
MKMNKLKHSLIIILILCSTSLLAQNIDSATTSDSPQITQIKPDNKLNSFSRPRHHAFLPRKSTVISLERFQENIDLDEKLKKSNEMLY